jgi:hypothetical protein
MTGRKLAASSKWLEAGLLLLPLAFATILYCFDYDLLLMVPLLAVLLGTELEEKIPAWAIGVGMLLGLCFMMPAFIFIHYFYILKGGAINPFFWLLALFAVSLLLLLRSQRKYFDY